MRLIVYLKQTLMSKGDWGDIAIVRACSTSEWAALVDTLTTKITTNLKVETGARFSKLSQKEQAAIVEREFHQVIYCLRLFHFA